MSSKVSDYRLKPLNRFQRPYFSPKRDSYEIDYVEQTYGRLKVVYLFCININTRYLMAYALELNEPRSVAGTRRLLDEMNTELVVNFGKDRMMKHIRGDADTAFGHLLQQGESYVIGPEEAKRLRRKETIALGDFWIKSNALTQYLAGSADLYLNSSPYTNKNRVIDRAIRTIRDKVRNSASMIDTTKVSDAVEVYNHTPHAAFNHEFTPFEVQSNPETEDYFIRESYYKLQEIKKLQRDEGLFDYQRGNVLLVHLSEYKTEQKFDKRRRNFDRLAIFVSYNFGNVVCRLLVIGNEGKQIGLTGDSITIPIYHTKYISRDINSIPLAYRKALTT
jgi:hypothetical protein